METTMQVTTDTAGNLAALVAELTRKLESLKAGQSEPIADAMATETAIDELLSAKTRGNRRSVYIKSLDYYLRRFAVKFPRLQEVTPSDVEGWLSQFKSNYSRQTWMNRINTLFSFAVRRGYVEKNPVNPLDRITIDRSAPSILTVQQSRQLLATVPGNCRPYLILGMFAGIRPDEIMRMTWADICLDTATARVDGKTRRRRIVPLEPIAVKLLSDCPKDSESLVPSRSTVRRWKRKAGKTLLGGRWRADILRHTAASYLVAKCVQFCQRFHAAKRENFFRQGLSRFCSRARRERSGCRQATRSRRARL